MKYNKIKQLFCILVGYFESNKYYHRYPFCAVTAGKKDYHPIASYTKNMFKGLLWQKWGVCIFFLSNEACIFRITIFFKSKKKLNEKVVKNENKDRLFRSTNTCQLLGLITVRMTWWRHMVDRRGLLQSPATVGIHNNNTTLIMASVSISHACNFHLCESRFSCVVTAAI
jgi:hypothetical protein